VINNHFAHVLQVVRVVPSDTIIPNFSQIEDITYIKNSVLKYDFAN